MRKTNISEIDRWKIEEQIKLEKSQSRDFRNLSNSLDQWKIDEQNEMNRAMVKAFKQIQK